MKNVAGKSIWIGIPALVAAGCVLEESDTVDTGEQETGEGPGGEAGEPIAQETCPEPPEVFDHALCVCEDFDEVGRLTVGPAAEDEGASVGVNEFTRIVSFTDIEGDLHAHEGLNATADLEVSGTIDSDGDVSFVGDLLAGEDLNVGGDFTGTGHLTVGENLRVAGDDGVVGTKDVGGEGEFSELEGAPCPCGSDEIVDVAAKVDEARDDNDNDEHDVPTSLASVGSSQLELSTGSYFFEDIQAVGDVEIVADGAVAIYLDGSLDAVGRQDIELEDGATLDLYVSEGVRTVGNITAGEESASDFRLFVGGEDAVKVSVGKQDFYGAIYAPEAPVRYVGDTNIRGSLFAQSLGSVGDLSIYAAEPGLPDECENGGDDGDNGDGGGDNGDGGGDNGGGDDGGGGDDDGDGDGDDDDDDDDDDDRDPPVIE